MKKLLYRLFFARNNNKAFLKYAIKITDKIMLGTFVKAAIVYSLPEAAPLLWRIYGGRSLRGNINVNSTSHREI